MCVAQVCWELLYRTWPCEDRHFGSVSTAKIQLSPEVHLQKRHTVLSHRIFFLQVLACSVFLVGQKAIEITCWECQMDDQLNFYINNFFPCDSSHSNLGLTSACPYHNIGTSEFISVRRWKTKAIPPCAAYEGIQPAVHI